jgi:hypothetical protein
MEYKTNISSSQTIRTIIVTKFPNIRSVGAYIAKVHACISHITHTTHYNKLIIIFSQVPNYQKTE